MTRGLLDKLGCHAGAVAWVVGCPADIAALASLPSAKVGQPQWLLGFAKDAAALAGHVAELVPHYRRGGHLWLAYPKKSGSIKSDIDRDHGWDALAELNLLPVTQVAIDANWSALRFRFRDEIAKLTRKF